MYICTRYAYFPLSLSNDHNSHSLPTINSTECF